MWIPFGNACQTDLLLMMLSSLDMIDLSCENITNSVAVVLLFVHTNYIAIDIDNDMNRMLSQTSTHPSLRAQNMI
jgi:hypothetical protein